MTALSSYPVDLSQTRKLDIQLKPVKLSDEQKAQFEKMREMLYSKPSNLDELKNHVSQKIYAEVKVNGQTVATLYNSGGAMTSNATHARVKNLPSMGEGEKSTGPELAQKRAEEIARQLGGKIVKASTAVTQGQYLATPAFKIEYEIDYAAMRAAEGRVTTPQTQVDTQLLAEAGKRSAVDEFLDYASLSWEQKILKSMGITEEELAAMSPEEREKIEAEIRRKIEEKVAQETGILPTATAV